MPLSIKFIISTKTNIIAEINKEKNYFVHYLGIIIFDPKLKFNI